MNLNILLTKVILKEGCDECNAIPSFKLNRFAKWSKDWYTYYSCDKHVNKVVDNRMCLDEFMEILEYDNTNLVQCYTCDNYTLDLPTLYAGENRYVGNCKFREKSLENCENIACRLCNQYIKKVGSKK